MCTHKYTIAVITHIVKTLVFYVSSFSTFGNRDYMIFIVCQRGILIYFSAKPQMVARLRGHDSFFCHVET